MAKDLRTMALMIRTGDCVMVMSVVDENVSARSSLEGAKVQNSQQRQWFVYDTVCILKTRTVGKLRHHEIIVPWPWFT